MEYLHYDGHLWVYSWLIILWNPSWQSNTQSQHKIQKVQERIQWKVTQEYLLKEIIDNSFCMTVLTPPWHAKHMPILHTHTYHSTRHSSRNFLPNNSVTYSLGNKNIH